MHYSYEKKLRHVADFRVKYTFYTPAEGGRSQLPFQGLRSDFCYSTDPYSEGGQVYRIWPEFEDENGELILEKDTPVPISGTARMWIINSARRVFHRLRIKPGLTCYFWESRPTAKCEVIEILGLFTNPAT